LGWSEEVVVAVAAAAGMKQIINAKHCNEEKDKREIDRRSTRSSFILPDSL
jgi:hypothetical protein